MLLPPRDPQHRRSPARRAEVASERHGDRCDDPELPEPRGKELGDRIAAFALANADRLSLNHVIWRRIIYDHAGKPSLMPNLGGDDANHYTHVHIATNGGGYPTGDESYFFG